MKTLSIISALIFISSVINSNENIDIVGRWLLFKRTELKNNKENDSKFIIEDIHLKSDSTFTRILIDYDDTSLRDTVEGLWKVEYIDKKPYFIFATYDALALGLIDTNEITLSNEKYLRLEKTYKLKSEVYKIKYYYGKYID